MPDPKKLLRKLQDLDYTVNELGRYKTGDIGNNIRTRRQAERFNTALETINQTNRNIDNAKMAMIASREKIQKMLDQMKEQYEKQSRCAVKLEFTKRVCDGDINSISPMQKRPTKTVETLYDAYLKELARYRVAKMQTDRTVILKSMIKNFGNAAIGTSLVREQNLQASFVQTTLAMSSKRSLL